MQDLIVLARPDIYVVIPPCFVIAPDTDALSFLLTPYDTTQS